MTRTRIIAVAGGTASGKTTLARDLVRVGGSSRVQIVPLDAYYRCSKHLPPEQRATRNYDHPDAFEIDLLERNLRSLLEGEAVDIPQYDFPNHARSGTTSRIVPSEVILVEGILALHFSALHALYASSVFVETPDQLRLLRRLNRDVKERGRTPESVYLQWSETVHPMHLEFCDPTRAIATEVFRGESWDDSQVAALLERLLK